MGLKEILEEINQDGAEESAAILNDAKVKSTQQLMKRQEELETLYTRRREALEEEAARLRKKLIAKAELEEQRDRFKSMHDLVDSILAEAFQKILEEFQSDTQKYIEYLAEIIDHDAKTLKTKKLQINLNEHDIKLFSAIKKKVKTEISLGETVHIQGGVICVYGRELIDHSLEVMFGHMRVGFVQYIDTRLQKAQG